VVPAALATELHNAVLSSSPVGWQGHQKRVPRGVTGEVVRRRAARGCPVGCFVTRTDSDMKERPDRSSREMPGYKSS